MIYSGGRQLGRRRWGGDPVPTSGPPIGLPLDSPVNDAAICVHYADGGLHLWREVNYINGSQTPSTAPAAGACAGKRAASSGTRLALWGV